MRSEGISTARLQRINENFVKAITQMLFPHCVLFILIFDEKRISFFSFVSFSARSSLSFSLFVEPKAFLNHLFYEFY